jgi:Sigma-70, region 4
MPRLDDLPPDLRATLSLLVDRGKSYAQVAELLGIPESAVRDRAHAALDALAGAADASEPPPASPSEAPSALSTWRPRATGQAASPSEQTARRAGSSPSGASSTLPVSRRGGALLLAGIVVVVVVVVVLLTSGGGGSHSSSGTSTAASTPANTKSTASTGTKSSSSKSPSVVKQLTLSPPEPGSKSIGIVEILVEGTQHAFYLAAEHLPPTQGFFYAVWLYNSPTSTEAISKSPTVGSNGRLQGGALLPSNAADFHQILLTRETSERPTHPGPTVLSSPFSLG